MANLEMKKKEKNYAAVQQVPSQFQDKLMVEGNLDNSNMVVVI